MYLDKKRQTAQRRHQHVADIGGIDNRMALLTQPPVRREVKTRHHEQEPESPELPHEVYRGQGTHRKARRYAVEVKQVSRRMVVAAVRNPQLDFKPQTGKMRAGAQHKRRQGFFRRKPPMGKVD